MFDCGDGRAEIARDGGQRRQIKIDADRGEDGQQPEQGDQFDAPDSRNFGTGKRIAGGGNHARGMGLPVCRCKAERLVF
jgi:hypothetical protein